MARVNLRQLNELKKRVIRPQSLFRAWGNYLERETVLAFRQETSPVRGEIWEPLKPQTIKRKQRRRNPRSLNKILRDTGDLYRSLNMQLQSDGVLFGTSRRVGQYSLGAIHQYGAPRRNIPPRPFLPVDSQGRLYSATERQLIRIFEDFLARDWKGLPIF